MTRIALSIFLIAFLITCNTNNSSSDDLADLEEARELWNTDNHLNYTYHYRSICFYCFAEEVRVIVEADSVVDVVDIKSNETALIEVNGELLPILEHFEQSFFTINGFFKYLESSLPDSESFSLNFDGTTGFPIEISIDPEVTIGGSGGTVYQFSNLSIN